MLSWKEIVQNYIIKHSDKIKKVTRPLRERLNVGYFTYHRVDKKGKYTVLLDRPDWAEHYVEEKYFLTDPYMRHPDMYKSGFTLIENHGSEEHRKKILKDGKEIFNLDLGLMLIEKSEDCVEFFGFCTNKATSQLEQVYLNQPGLLKSYASHFKKEMRPILLPMEGEASSLINLKGKDFHTKELIHPGVDSPTLKAYLKDMGKAREIDLAGQLSRREKQCIRLLLAGKSAKDTAAILKLSHRTIEFYFENIKNKLSCSTKQEIFFLGQQFQELGLLSGEIAR
jgi:DNA-binding CsgD family transcriptional regulator